MNPSSARDHKEETGTESVMRHHRASWRVERVGWAVIALVMVATLLGVFGDGPISHVRSGSVDALTVEYERLLRASAPTEYRFIVAPSFAVKGVLHLRIENSLMHRMQVDSIVPEPDRQRAGSKYTEFSFAVGPGVSPVTVLFRLRPTTFGHHKGRVSVSGIPPLWIDHVIYP